MQFELFFYSELGKKNLDLYGLSLLWLMEYMAISKRYQRLFRLFVFNFGNQEILFNYRNKRNHQVRLNNLMGMKISWYRVKGIYYHELTYPWGLT